MNNRILVVEDDQKIARVIELQLRHSEYQVDLAHDGLVAESMFKSNAYDLVLLDVMLPKVNGFELCSRIRQNSDVPIIMLTAKDDVTDKVIGLDFGANDYITKPFDIEEIRARIRVQLRDKSDKIRQDKVDLYDIEINYKTMQVIINGSCVRFTKTEFDLLSFLAENRGIVLKREVILEKVWGYEYFGNDNVLDVYIKYLRDKLKNSSKENIIETVRGVGYVIR